MLDGLVEYATASTCSSQVEEKTMLRRNSLSLTKELNVSKPAGSGLAA